MALHRSLFAAAVLALLALVGPAGAQTAPGPSADWPRQIDSVAGTIAGFTLNKSTGALASISGSPYNAGTTPLCLGVEPLQGEFLYAVNQLSGSVSAYKLTGNTGQLSGVPNQPFQISSNSGSAPVCLATAANGPTPIPGTP